MAHEFRWKHRRWRFWLLLGAGVVLGIPLLLSAVLGVINRCDEELSPGAEAATKFALDDIPPEQNAYYVFAGIHAPAGQDAHAHGRELMQRVADYFSVSDATRERENTPKRWEVLWYTSASLKYRGPPAEKLCPQPHCLPGDAREAERIEALLRDNRELVARYRAAYRYPRFADMRYPDAAAPLPGYSALPHRLIVAEMGRQIVRGDTAAALRALREDTRLWRAALRDARDVVTKSTAARHLADNARLAGEWLASRPVSRAERWALAAMFAPLDDAERNMEGALRGEFAMHARMFMRLLPQYGTEDCRHAQWQCFHSNLVYQHHATVNRVFARHQAMLAIANSPAALAAHRAAPAHRPDGVDWRWDLVYNPVGKMLTQALLPPDPSGHAARVHNLDGLLKLLNLQIELKRRAVPHAQLPAFLAASPLKDPYTGQPMQWDATAQSIYFMGLQDPSVTGEAPSSVLNLRVALRL